MGNYSGTIRCGYCGQQGHNRAGCEKLTEELSRRFELLHQAVKDGQRSEDDYTFTRTRQLLAKRIGQDPITGESKRKRRATYGGRVCGYCGENGHNRRTCPQQKTDRERFAALTVETRATVLDALRTHGIAPGALLSHDEYGTVTPCLVTGIKWDSIHRKAKWPTAIIARRVTDNKPCTLAFPKEVTGSSNRWDSVSILSRAHAAPKPPVGWEAASNLDYASVDIFVKGAKRDYWFWRDIDDE